MQNGEEASNEVGDAAVDASCAYPSHERLYRLFFQADDCGFPRRARVRFDPVRQVGTRDSLRLSAHHPVKVPAVGYALELVFASILEREL